MSDLVKLDAALGTALRGCFREIVEPLVDQVRELREEVIELRKHVRPKSDRGLSVKEAAIKLGISENSIRSLIKQGKIRPFNIGGKLVISERQLDLLLEGKPPNIAQLPDNASVNDIVRAVNGR